MIIHPSLGTNPFISFLLQHNPSKNCMLISPHLLSFFLKSNQSGFCPLHPLTPPIIVFHQITLFKITSYLHISLGLQNTTLSWFFSSLTGQSFCFLCWFFLNFFTFRFWWAQGLSSWMCSLPVFILLRTTLMTCKYYLYMDLLIVQSRPTLCNPTDCSPPGSSVHGDSPNKNTGVGCHALLQGIFPTQGSNLDLPHCRQILYHLSHQGSPSVYG